MSVFLLCLVIAAAIVFTYHQRDVFTKHPEAGVAVLVVATVAAMWIHGRI